VSAAERARWLAELAQVLEHAQELVTRLAVAEGRKSEALDVCARLEATRAEVQSLRRNRTGEAPADSDPEWSRRLVSHRTWPQKDG
jgi:acyl-CoA reductase-like NAD-dependent aldehyde dehydrogenase